MMGPLSAAIGAVGQLGSSAMQIMTGSPTVNAGSVNSVPPLPVSQSQALAAQPSPQAQALIQQQQAQTIGTVKDVVSGIMDVTGMSGKIRGRNAKEYLDAAHPGTSPAERIQSGQSDPGAGNDREFQSTQRLHELNLAKVAAHGQMVSAAADRLSGRELNRHIAVSAPIVPDRSTSVEPYSTTPSAYETSMHMQDRSQAHERSESALERGSRQYMQSRELPIQQQQADAATTQARAAMRGVVGRGLDAAEEWIERTAESIRGYGSAVGHIFDDHELAEATHPAVEREALESPLVSPTDVFVPASAGRLATHAVSAKMAGYATKAARRPARRSRPRRESDRPLTATPEEISADRIRGSVTKNPAYKKSVKNLRYSRTKRKYRGR